MNLEILGRLIERTLQDPVPVAVAQICVDYYAPYYTLMYRLAEEIERGLAVELGVEKGRGSASLAAGSQWMRVIGADHTRREEVAGLQMQFSNFLFLEQPSLPVPDMVRAQGKPIDILHIDTEHSYAMAQEEFKAYQSLLAAGAVVLFDDVHAEDDGVLKYFMTLPYPKIHDDRLHPITGFGVLLYV